MTESQRKASNHFEPGTACSHYGDAHECPTVKKLVQVDGQCITQQHAESLVALLKWYRQMVAAFHEQSDSDKHGSQKGLTVAYCDELIEALELKNETKPKSEPPNDSIGCLATSDPQ